MAQNGEWGASEPRRTQELPPRRKRHWLVNGTWIAGAVALLAVGYNHPLIKIDKPDALCAAGVNLDWRDIVGKVLQDSTRRAVEVYWTPLSKSSFDGIVYEFRVWRDTLFSRSEYYDNTDPPCVRIRGLTPGRTYHYNMRAGGHGGYLLSGDDTLFVSDTLWFLTDNGTEWTDSMSFTFPTAIETTRMGEQLIFTDVRTVADERFVSPDTVPEPPVPFEITTPTTAEGKVYDVVTADVDVLQYLDRSYTIAVLPEYLVGSTYIRTANDDKNAASGEDDFMGFEINRLATVYVAHDDRVPRPDWLTDWFTFTLDGVVSSDGDLRFTLYRRKYEVGGVYLGSNNVEDVSRSSMYVVFVVPE